VKFEVAIVYDIVLDDSNEFFTDAGGWQNGIGAISFKVLKGVKRKTSSIAYPYFPNFANYPLKGEVVYVFKLPSPEAQENLDKEVYYYLTPVNIWGNPNHNSLPNLLENTEIPQNQQRDYQQASAGAVNIVTAEANPPLILGTYFLENSRIKPLKKFEGDVLIESRVGSSIRFGTTAVNGNIPLNNWSQDGYTGQPITIIRNGQGAQGVGPQPTEEHINNDNSSIYLTNTQQIPLEPSSTNDYYSYNKKPQPAKEYSGDQIILNSGRLFFNSKTDSILLSSNQTINLNSVLSVNIDTEDLVVQSTKVYLGSKNAKEPILYGDRTVDMLGDIIDLLEVLLTASATASASGAPIATLNAVGILQQNTIGYLKQNLENLKSETVFIA
jgi:hypothetical protein